MPSAELHVIDQLLGNRASMTLQRPTRLKQSTRLLAARRAIPQMGSHRGRLGSPEIAADEQREHAEHMVAGACRTHDVLLPAMRSQRSLNNWRARWTRQRAVACVMRRMGAISRHDRP